MKKAIATLLLLLIPTNLSLAHPAPPIPKVITCKMICHRMWFVRTSCTTRWGRWEFYEGEGEGRGIYKQYLNDTLYYGIWEWKGDGKMEAKEWNPWLGSWVDYHYYFHPGKMYWKDQELEVYDSDGTMEIYSPHLLPIPCPHLPCLLP